MHPVDVATATWGLGDENEEFISEGENLDGS